MAKRRSMPHRCKSFAAPAAMLLLGAVYAAPVVAASTVALQCDQDYQASLLIRVDDLTVRVVNHDLPATLLNQSPVSPEIDIASSTEFLAPRAAAAIRDAFSADDNSLLQSKGTKLTLVTVKPLISPILRSDTKRDLNEPDEEQVDSAKVMNARLPGVSENDLSRFKKRMYRRDI